MLQRLLILFGAVVLCAVIATGSIVLAEGTPASSGAPASGISAVTSSTSLQSFLWVFDHDAHAVTFCFSVASPETGPQYDFKCRTRTMADANVAP